MYRFISSLPIVFCSPPSLLKSSILERIYTKRLLKHACRLSYHFKRKETASLKIIGIINQCCIFFLCLKLKSCVKDSSYPFFSFLTKRKKKKKKLKGLLVLSMLKGCSCHVCGELVSHWKLQCAVKCSRPFLGCSSVSSAVIIYFACPFLYKDERKTVRMQWPLT